MRFMRDVFEVYPRVCGGTVDGRAHAAGVIGLSPRVRGNREMHPHASDFTRSIPACAGEPHSPRDLNG